VSTIEIRRIDPHDESLLRRWWETGHAAQAERPHDLFSPWEVDRVALTRENADHDVVLLGALEHDRMVGSALVRLTRQDNLHLAEARVDVLPERRGRGVGTALLEAVEETGRAAGRTHLLVEAPALPDAENVGARFGAARGYAVANHEELKILDLAASSPRWGALQEEVDDRLGGYRIVRWGNETPEEYIQGFCDLLSMFLSQVPLGDIPLEDSEWTPARLRQNEERVRAVGRESWTAAAIAPDGTVCGVSDLRLNRVAPRLAHVGITMVRPEHRGHRLGLALKLATHTPLLTVRPECELVVTGNAGVNDHMNAVNAKLGYHVVEELLEMQKVL